MTDKVNDPIKAAQDHCRRDGLTADKVLFAIRCGADVEIMNDPETGWTMSCEGLSAYIPFETGEAVVNMILQCLVSHCRQLAAVLDNPDLHDVRQLSLK
jgi:hypothetical protein